MDERTAILAELNNEGASYVKTGRFNESIQILKTAMKMAMRISQLRHHALELFDDDDDDNDYQDEATMEQEARLKLSQVRENAQKDATSKRKNRSSSTSLDHTPNSRARIGGYDTARHHKLPPNSGECDDDNDISHDAFIYSEPIRVIDRYNPPSSSEMLLTIVFNMALSYHLKALDRHRVCKKRFHKALKLYELANYMETEQGIEISASHSLAILNNVAQVYKMVGRTDKSERLLLRMLTTIAYIVDNGASSQVGHMDGFVQNVSHLILKQAPVARAA